MSSIADALELLIKQIISNIDTLTLRRIRTKARGDLTLDNGAGASIVLTGDQVLINGFSGSSGGVAATFDIIYLGADHLCWICRDPTTLDLVFHVKQGTGIMFEAIHRSTIVANVATYIALEAGDTNYGTTDTMLVETESGGVSREAVIQFNSVGISFPATNAKLRLYSMVSEAGSTSFQVSYILGTIAQNTVTYDNLPVCRYNGAVGSYSYTNTGGIGWIELDVTSLYNDSNNGQNEGSFAIKMNYVSGVKLTFASASSGTPPELIITH